MSKTTELLKRIEEHEKRTSCMYVTGRNELKGRLDILKEEVEWLIPLKDDLNENKKQLYALFMYSKDRLASIREEIKLIEGAI